MARCWCRLVTTSTHESHTALGEGAGGGGGLCNVWVRGAWGTCEIFGWRGWGAVTEGGGGGGVMAGGMLTSSTSVNNTRICSTAAL